MAGAKYRVLSAFSLGGGRDVFPGDVVELEGSVAQMRLYEQRVAPLLPGAEDADPEHPEIADGADVTDGDPETENQDPKPRRGRRGQAQETDG